MGRANCRRLGTRFVARRTVACQALVPAQHSTLVTANGPRGKRRKLTGAIGFEEGLAENSERFEPRQNLSQLCFGFHAAQDQMGMVGGSRKSARHFEARMAGLNGLLRK